MKATWLVGLYPREWRRRYGDEIAHLLGQERLTAQLVLDLVRGALDARLHPELVAPLLAAAGGGTLEAPPRSPRVGAYVLAVVLLLLIVFGGLYAYRAQTPAIPSVPLTQVVSEVAAGRVTAVEFNGTQVTITLTDGTRERTVVPNAPAEPVSAAVNEYNRSHPANAVRLNYATDVNPLSAAAPVVFGFLVAILPIALLVLLILLLARRLGSDGESRHASRYEWLARIADLRDRGVLTEEEFQREKRRLLE